MARRARRVRLAPGGGAGARVDLRFRADDVERLQLLAEHFGVNRSQFVRDLVVSHLDRWDPVIQQKRSRGRVRVSQK